MKHLLSLMFTALLSCAILPQANATTDAKPADAPSSEAAPSSKLGKVVTTYESDQGEEVSMVSYIDDDGEKMFLLFFEGFDSEWDGKALLHSYAAGRNKKYIHGTQYASVVDSGASAVRDGKRVALIDVYAKGGKGKKTLWISKPKRKADEIFKAFHPAT